MASPISVGVKSAASGSRTSIKVTLPKQRIDSPSRPTSSDRLYLTSPPMSKYSDFDNSPNLGSKHNTPVTGAFSHSSGIQAPTTTPRETPIVLSHQEVSAIVAVRIIERAWLAYRDRQMFSLLKHAVCAAEHSLTYEILRKVSPKEAEFLKDPSMNVRVRFRFGGTEFPPMIYFKIYTHSSANGMGVKYFSGKRVIKPASEAAQDACNIMGNREFYNQMIQDALYQEQKKISDETDVTTLKDYMQYLANLDETPAKEGGKENLWRKLTQDVIPRYTIFHDVIDYLYNQKLSPSLAEELPTLLSRPITQEIQLRQIKLISRIRTPPLAPCSTPKGKFSSPQSSTARRSKQARIRALKMKRMYGLEATEQKPSDISENRETKLTFDLPNEDDDLDKMDEHWEIEADKLYEWTQDLSFEDISTSPRLNSMVT
ncbi:unnamed protein product [Owenia fusiformis]|uniref:Uncharacterized protein n=1 Tax=Owenia fusiformis TaxID=6347 RepID=A0A8J1V0D1_OWEFU|nr:unnamed protein product [Owenia fusiformis]